MKNRGLKKVAGVFIFLAVFAGMAAVVMLLWNALIPAIVGWSVISYWQAAGLLLLCRLLLGGFGRFGGHGMGFGHHNKGFFDKQNHEKMHEKFKGMSREERREFIMKRMHSMHDAFHQDEFEDTDENTTTQTEK